MLSNYINSSVTSDKEKFIVVVAEKADDKWLYCQVGCLCDNGELKWNECDKFCNGKNASIAMNTKGEVIVVYESVHYKNYLSARVGKIDKENLKVKWSKLYNKYDKGLTPSVAIADDGLIIEVHKSQNSNFLFRNIGNIDGINYKKTFKSKLFISSAKIYSKGKNPSIAICTYKERKYALEAHKHPIKETIFYLYGRFRKSQKSICWNSHVFDYRLNRTNGINPSVILNSDMSATIVFQGFDYQCRSKLYFSKGKIKENLYKEGFDKCYELGEFGSAPSATRLKDGLLFILYRSNEKSRYLANSINSFVERPVTVPTKSIFTLAFDNDLKAIKVLLSKEKTEEGKKKLLNSKYKMQSSDIILLLLNNSISFGGHITRIFNTKTAMKMTKNTYYRTSWTPLHFAVAGNSRKVIKFLIKNDVKKTQDKYKRTFLELAKDYNNIKGFYTWCKGQVKKKNKNQKQKNKIQKNKNLELENQVLKKENKNLKEKCKQGSRENILLKKYIIENNERNNNAPQNFI